jgi:hypothetical protein
MGSTKTNTAEAGARHVVKNRQLAVLINVALVSASQSVLSTSLVRG